MKKNVAGQNVYFSLFKAGARIANPTIAVADFKRSLDGAGQNNVTTPPTSDAAGLVTWVPSQAETNADCVTLLGLDALGAEWEPLTIVFYTEDSTSIASLEADVWGYATRTLTTATGAAYVANDGGKVTIHRGDSMSVSFTGLGDISGRSKLWFTVKSDKADLDPAALILIEETAGLLYLNGAVAANAANGDITVTNAVTGAITVVLDETETDDLAIAAGLRYDVQMLTAAGAVSTLTEDAAEVSADVTRRVA